MKHQLFRIAVSHGSRQMQRQPWQRWVLGGSSLLCASLTWAQSPMPATRMQLCASQVEEIEPVQRKRLLRECLVIRAEAERGLERDCRNQLRAVSPAPNAQERHELQKQCMAKSSSTKYTELPRRPAPKAASEPLATEQSAPDASSTAKTSPKANIVQVKN